MLFFLLLNGGRISHSSAAHPGRTCFPGTTVRTPPWRLLLFSAAELVLFAVLYPFGLRRLGRLLQRREKDILQTVTQEVE